MQNGMNYWCKNGQELILAIGHTPVHLEYLRHSGNVLFCDRRTWASWTLSIFQVEILLSLTPGSIVTNVGGVYRAREISNAHFVGRLLKSWSVVGVDILHACHRTPSISRIFRSGNWASINSPSIYTSTLVGNHCREGWSSAVKEPYLHTHWDRKKKYPFVGGPILGVSG